MGLIIERDGAAGGYSAVTLRGAPGEADSANQNSANQTRSADAPSTEQTPGAEAAPRAEETPNAEETPSAETAPSAGDAVLYRQSALPSRRSVLYVLCQQDSFVSDDLVTWYTERGFHFYITDLRLQDQMVQPDVLAPGEPGRAECFARLDAATRQLRGEGIDMIIVGAHAAAAHTAALWCDARRDAGVADALILSGPAFGRRLRRGLDIACPVLVLSGPRQARGGRLALGTRRRGDGAIRLGAHVTWLRLEPPEGEAADADTGQRRMFGELGRWLGAYMYGQVRDQLL